jgi:hypothetical protein
MQWCFMHRMVMRESYFWFTQLNKHTKFCPSLWSSGQSSWLQIQRSGFDSRHYQIFWEVVGLERDPLSLVSTTEELLGRKSSSSSGPENREYSHRDLSRWPHDSLYLQKFALTSPTSGSHSVGIVRLWTRPWSLVLMTTRISFSKLLLLL